MAKTWLEDIITALEELGGLSSYKEIYERVKEIRTEPLPKSWTATIRGTIERNSSDSTVWTGVNDFFYSAEGLGSGVWGLRSYYAKRTTVDLTEDDISFPEGKKILKQHIFRERNPRLVIEAKKRFLAQHGRLFCQSCGFDFVQKYGPIAKGFIEVHHVKPLHLLKDDENTRVEDLILVCSNCHRVIHRIRPWLGKEQLIDKFKPS